MEFEKDTPVSDDQRRLAEVKKLTLQPTHTNIVPEDISDSAIAAQHLNGQPIANATNDIEQDAPLLRPLQSTEDTNKLKATTHTRAIILIASIAIVAIVALGLFIILK